MREESRGDEEKEMGRNKGKKGKRWKYNQAQNCEGRVAYHGQGQRAV